MSNYYAGIEDTEEHFKIRQCHRKLRSLSKGSAIFNESDCILDNERSVNKSGKCSSNDTV